MHKNILVLLGLMIAILLWMPGCGSSDNNEDGDTDGDQSQSDGDDEVIDGDNEVIDGDEETIDGDIEEEMEAEATDYSIDPDGDVDGVAVDDAYLVSPLAGTVNIAYDDLGIPHIFAQSRKDAMVALGYVQAETRLTQMDFFRKLARGKLSGLLVVADETLLGYDKYHRAVFSTIDGGDLFQAIYDAMDDNTKELVQAFADGVNNRLERYRADSTGWPELYKNPLIQMTPEMFENWSPLDSIAIARYQTWDLSYNYSNDINRTLAYLTLGEDLYNQLVFSEPAAKVSIMPHEDSLKTKSGDVAKNLFLKGRKDLIKSLEKERDFMRGLEAFVPNYMEGASNNWVVEPDASGTSYLCNDPHLALYSPSVFIPISMTVGNGEELFAGGVAFPGTPLVVIGRNEKVAWGETVVGYDNMDVYEETLTLDENNEPVSVLYNGSQVNLVKVVHHFKNGNIDSGESLSDTLYFVPHHGPILMSSLDLENKTAFSLRWTGLDVTNEIKAFVDLQTVSDVQEAFTAVEYFDVGAQNFVFADVSGNIGWYPHALVPDRDCDMSVTPPWMVLPGSGGCEWDGYLSNDKLPKQYNPDEGFIVTANNDPTGDTLDNDPTNDGDFFMFEGSAIGYRALSAKEGIKDLINAGTYDWEDMAELQFSYKSVYAREMVPIIVDLAKNVYGITESLSADAATGLSLLENWDYYTYSGLSDPADPANVAAVTDADVVASAAATTFYFFLVERLGLNIFKDEIVAKGYTGSVPGINKAFIKIMRDLVPSERTESPLFDDVSTTDTVETVADILIKSFNEAAADELYSLVYSGTDIDKSLWGRLHTLTLKHPLSSATTMWDKGPYGLGGGPYAVNVANFGPRFDPDHENYTFSSGPSLRIINEVTSSGIKTHFNLPGGVDERADSEHFDDLLKLWMSGETTDLNIAWEDVKTAGVERLMQLKGSVE